MKVLLISVKKKHGSTGGIAVWTEHYLSRCAQHDVSPTLVNTEKVKRYSVRVLDEFSRTARIFKELNVVVRSQAFDIAHLNTSCGPMGLFRDYLIAKKLKRKGIPFVTHYHCDIPTWITSALKQRVVRSLASMSHCNFVLCENSRVYLEQFGIDAVKVPNFIEDSVLITAPKTIQPTLDRIFFVGRISLPKGAAEIYELARRFPEKTFLLAGRPYAPVTEWEVPANLKLLGAMPYQQVLSCLDEADAFLFPSHTEGFSMALMEAMARGVPAIAVDTVGANADMLADNCGITVPLQDVDAMERAIRQLEDPALRTAISRNAVDKVTKQYTTDAVLSLFKSHYDTLV